MSQFGRFAATAVVAVLALGAADLSASAQSLTNGRHGMQPDRLASKTRAGHVPSRAYHSRMSYRYGYRPMRRYAAARPLVVRPAPIPAPVVATGPVVAGPGALVTGPIAFGSDVAAFPFRALNSIFPATGDIATNPLVAIGAPIHVAGQLAQIPFQIVSAPFGGTTAAY